MRRWAPPRRRGPGADGRGHLHPPAGDVPRRKDPRYVRLLSEPVDFHEPPLGQLDPEIDGQIDVRGDPHLDEDPVDLQGAESVPRLELDPGHKAVPLNGDRLHAGEGAEVG